uniref:Uncharacterized protein n=1 Tax=Arundo donax TaxID=35708 RepID=A0A0A9HAB1_ARUDO
MCSATTHICLGWPRAS